MATAIRAGGSGEVIEDREESGAEAEAPTDKLPKGSDLGARRDVGSRGFADAVGGGEDKEDSEDKGELLVAILPAEAPPPLKP